MGDLIQNFEKRYQRLNPAQKKAVDTIDGPVLVIAGPGSGKTELLSMRVANILKLTDSLPSSILCLTFTDSAAANMRKRLAGLIGADAYRVAIHTFHSFGREIINSSPEYFYHGAFYNPADDITRIEILEEILTNLHHSSNLNKFHPEQGYTYLKDLVNKISELKRGGLSPEEFERIILLNKEFLAKANPLVAAVFADRISKKMFGSIGKLIEELAQIQIADGWKVPNYHSIQEVLITNLKSAFEDATNDENTKPVTGWKNSYTKKNFKKELVLKDFDNVNKQLELAKIYAEYQKSLHAKGFMDFDDMLMDSVAALEKNPELRFNLQEKYQYVLVDEFQDTSGVQMRLLDNLLDAEVNEGRPNILAVGDDDQSIFKFQGAHIANILNFQQKYRDPVFVVLMENYRSTQKILDLIRKIIKTGSGRLENLYPEMIKKELVAAANFDVQGEVLEKSFATGFEEMVWITGEIQKLLAAGTDPAQIAVIAPKHKILQEMAKILDYHKITVAYSRRKNLLEQKHLKEILLILNFIDSLNKKGQTEADELLPEILNFSFWGLKRLDIWRVSVEANRRRKNSLWLEVMLDSENPKLKNLAKFLIKLGGEAKEKTVEEIIDFITGIKSLDIEEEDKEAAGRLFSEPEFCSPFKEFYFNAEKFKNEQVEYFDYLNSLKAFIDKVRKYKGGKALSVSDLVEFLELHKKHKIELYLEDYFNNEDKSVNLLTVHKAKGLEFEAVFVISCEDGTWMKSGFIDKLSFPSNLPLAAESDTTDDKLRLFYVALSRAKHNLYLTRHDYVDNGNSLSRLRFLEGTGLDGADADVAASSVSEGAKSPARVKNANVALEQIQNINLQLAQQKDLLKFLELQNAISVHVLRNTDENDLLKSQLKNYKLSFTHLANFLNIKEGGPHYFLAQNLLRFPQKKNIAGSYGSAMHKALDDFLLEYNWKKVLPSLEFLLQKYEEALNYERLNKKDFASKLAQGRDHLSLYYEQRRGDFNPEDRSEYNFRTQNVVVSGAAINGKIDKMRINRQAKEITVYDYKTGKAFTDWQTRNDYDQSKLWRNKNQLIFYKLLVENSREFMGKYVVNKGVLEFLDPIKGSAGGAGAGEIAVLELAIEAADVEQMAKLIGVVYKKIMALDLPDVSKYEKSQYGVECFVEDLIEGKI